MAPAARVRSAPSSPPLAVRLAPLLAVLVLGTAALGTGCGGGQGVGPQNQNDAGPGSDARADSGVEADADLCGVGDDEKVVPSELRVFNGTEEPEMCLSPMQQLAVGALVFEYQNWENACTGTLIADDVVLTAAHCVRDWWGDVLSAHEVRFVVGQDAKQPELTFGVESLHPHPDYQGESSHDVAVLVLSGGVAGSGLDLLPIPASQTPLDASFVGERVQNVGFGATHDNENNHKRFWTVEEVTQVLPGELVVYGGGVSSVCWGDSGGPSFYLFEQGPDSSAGARLATIGTVSWGDESCVDYDHFARIDDNAAFIQGYTGPMDPCVGVDVVGLCDGDVALWCEGGALRQRCCGAEDMACVQEGSERARCVDQCGELTWEGRCAEGEVAEWCEGGVVRRRHCIPCAQTCGWAGDALGYYCVDP